MQCPPETSVTLHARHGASSWRLYLDILSATQVERNILSKTQKEVKLQKIVQEIIEFKVKPKENRVVII